MIRCSLVLLTIFLSGCTWQKYDLDAEVTENLPPEVALEYITMFYPDLDNIDRKYPPNGTCDFNLKTMSGGKSGQRPYSEFRVEVILAANIYHFHVRHDSESLKFNKSCSYRFNKVTAIKAATALKSLGAKIP